MELIWKNRITNISAKPVTLSIALLCLSAALMVISVTIQPPLQDYPEWVRQGYIGYSILSGFENENSFFFKLYPVPYAISQGLLIALMYIFSPSVAANILLLTYLAINLLVFYRLKVLNPHLNSLTALLFFGGIVLNSPFWNGYLGFQFGLTAITIYLILNRVQKLSLFALSLTGIICFLCHGLTMVCFWIIAGAFCLMHKKILRCCIAVIPSLLLTITYFYYTSQADSPTPEVGHDSSGIVHLLSYKAYTLAKLGPYHNFAPYLTAESTTIGLAHGLGILFNIAFAAFAVLLLIFISYPLLAAKATQGDKTLNPNLKDLHAYCLSAVIMFTVFVISPPAVNGIVNPGERLLYPMLLCIMMASLLSSGKTQRFDRFAPMFAIPLLLSTAFLVKAALDLKQSNTFAKSPKETTTLFTKSFTHRPFQFYNHYRHLNTLYAKKLPETRPIPVGFDTSYLDQSASYWQQSEKYYKAELAKPVN